MQIIQNQTNQSYSNLISFKPEEVKQICHTKNDSRNQKQILSIEDYPAKQVSITVPVRVMQERVLIPVRYSTESVWTEKRNLVEKCIVWCIQTYGCRVIIQEMPQVQTYTLIIPARGIFLIQFAIKKQPVSGCQYQFQNSIHPIPIYVFRSFRSFALFLKRKMCYDA